MCRQNANIITATIKSYKPNNDLHIKTNNTVFSSRNMYGNLQDTTSLKKTPPGGIYYYHRKNEILVTQIHRARDFRDMDHFRDLQETMENTRSEIDTFNIDAITDLVTRKRMKMAHKALHNLVERIASMDIRKFLKKKVRTKATYIGMLLGLNEAFIENIQESEDTHNRVSQGWIQGQLDTNMYKNANRVTFFEQDRTIMLKKLGFSEERALKFDQIYERTRAMQNITPWNWCAHYVERKFRTDPLLDQTHYNRYNIPSILDMILSNLHMQEYHNPFSLLLAERTININVMATKKPVYGELQQLREDELIETYMQKPSKEINKYRYWFHATSQKDAANIALNGILLHFGKCNLDFSDGNGFYITPNILQAYDWGQAMHPDELAIIVFKFEGDQTFQENEGINFDKPYYEWQQVVEHHRSGREQRISLTIKSMLSGSSYIYGPIASNSSVVKASDPIEYQLCIRDRHLANRAFNNGSAINNILFFSKTE